MDTFFEQIVAIKKSRKNIIAFIAIWVLALLLCVFAFFLFMAGFLGGLFILLLAGIVYGAYKLSSMLNIEYEYIVTNGTFDIDRIVNKSTRKRVASFDISIVSRLEKYNESLLNNVDTKDIIFACNGEADNTYILVYQKPGKNAVYVVFAPNDKMKSAITKFLPKFIANSAFK